MLNDFEYKRLMKELTPKLKVALARMLPPSEIDDVIQEAFMALYVTASKTQVDNPTALVYRVSRNIAIDKLRAKQTFESVKERLIDDGTDSISVLTSTERSLLIEVINKLPPICRNVFVMRKAHDMSHIEIAQILNISPKTVENHLAKGIKLCRDYCSRNATRVTALVKRHSG